MKTNTVRQLCRYEIQKFIDISSISTIHYFEFDERFVDELEAHECWEMVYVDRGECNVIADNRIFLLKQGEMYFHKPFEKHMLQMINGICPNIFVITFFCQSPAMIYFEENKLQASLSTKQHISAILHEASNTFDLPFNNPYADGLEPKKEGALPGGEQSIVLRLELMMIELIRKNKYCEKKLRMFHPKEIVEDEFCLKVISYMESHLYEKLSMDELSRAVSYSRSYISRKFISVCGYSVFDYFNLMKINEAKMRIREGNKTFNEISEMLMFSNSHYFSTIFKKYVGMTPSQYKRSCKEH